MKKCKHAKNYKGIHPPRCDSGNGCDACRAKYAKKHDRDLPPFEPTSTFAVISIKRGREGLKKLVDQNVEVEVTITGRISRVWGDDDGIDREFSLDINSLKLGKAVLVPKDKTGRRYALAKHVLAGDKLQCDSGFDCLPAGAIRVVKFDAKKTHITGLSGYYINCNDKAVKHRHYLDGQLGYTPETEGALVGLYPVPVRKK